MQNREKKSEKNFVKIKMDKDKDQDKLVDNIRIRIKQWGLRKDKDNFQKSERIILHKG